jgi:hypothetical protein
MQGQFGNRGNPRTDQRPFGQIEIGLARAKAGCALST